MTKIIKLKEPEGGFKIDEVFAEDLGERLKAKEVDTGLMISEAISLFLEKYEIKNNIII